MPFYKSIKQIRNKIQGDISQISNITLDVIEALENQGKALKAVSFLDKEFSYYQAKKLEKVESTFPLKGVPLAHKELFGRVKTMTETFSPIP